MTAVCRVCHSKRRGQVGVGRAHTRDRATLLGNSVHKSFMESSKHRRRRRGAQVYRDGHAGAGSEVAGENGESALEHFNHEPRRLSKHAAQGTRQESPCSGAQRATHLTRPCVCFFVLCKPHSDCRTAPRHYRHSRHSCAHTQPAMLRQRRTSTSLPLLAQQLCAGGACRT